MFLVFRRRFLIFALIALFAYAGTQNSLAQSSRMQMLNNASAAASQDHSLITILASDTCNNSTLPEISQSTGCVDAFSQAERDYLKTGKSAITNRSLASALNYWYRLIEFIPPSLATGEEVREYRVFLADFAPALFPKQLNGTVSRFISPQEAVFLLEQLISSGEVPSVLNHSATSFAKGKHQPLGISIQEYTNAVERYYSTVSALQQKADAQRLLKKSGLFSPSN